MPSNRYRDVEQAALSTPPGVPPSQAQADSSGAARFGRIQIAQSQLRAHGFDPGHAPNGALTQGTQSAIAAFQKAKGLTPTGTLDPRTQEKLGSAPGAAGRRSGSRRMNGGPTLVRTANAAAGGGKHARQSHPRETSTSAPSPQAATRGTTMRADTTQFQSAGKRVPAIFASPGTILPGASLAIVVQPQIQFRGENIVCDATTAAWFSMTNLQVGNDPQIAVGSGGIPMTLFVPGQNGAVDYEMDLCNAGTQMTMTVTNTDTIAHAFVATIFGHEIVAV